MRIKFEAIGNTSRSAGFTIVEAAVAMGIVGIVVVSLLAALAWGFKLIRNARENVRATQILQEKTEAIRIYNWDQINDHPQKFIPKKFTALYDPTNSSSGVIYKGTVTIDDAPVTEKYGSTLRQVDVEVTWDSGNVKQTRKLTTFVSLYGLQNYIY
jgi:uncharacterized protein (TIGR02598 family)